MRYEAPAVPGARWRLHMEEAGGGEQPEGEEEEVMVMEEAGGQQQPRRLADSADMLHRTVAQRAALPGLLVWWLC